MAGMKKILAPKKKNASKPIPKPLDKNGMRILSSQPKADGGVVKDEKAMKVKLVDEPISVKMEEPDYDNRPSISFYESQLPEISGMAINDKITLCIEVEMQSINKQDWGKEKGQICANFKVNKVGVDNDSDKD